MELFIMIVLCIAPTPEVINFIIQTYLTNEECRPIVQDVLFNKKEVLLLGLCNYLNHTPISKQDEATIKDLLLTIPRKIWVSTGMVTAGTRLYDLYMSIDPKQKKKHEAALDNRDANAI